MLLMSLMVIQVKEPFLKINNDEELYKLINKLI